MSYCACGVAFVFHHDKGGNWVSCAQLQKMIASDETPETIAVRGEPGFRFTNWGPAGRDTLDHWREWFKLLGVPAEVRGNKYGQTALFRQGEERRGS